MIKTLKPAVRRFQRHLATTGVRGAVAGLAGIMTAAALGAEMTRGTPEPEFSQNIRPILQEYCLGCHSTEKHKGDMDLERFTAFSEVLRHPKPWQQVTEQLSLGEMPPKGKPAPTAAERERLLSWVESALDEAAKASAGDPGPVPLRRLDNAEYTYTVRDLTGVESLNPAKEFPADSAAGEGFMNTGNALVMSPALLSKYLDAGKEIASHAVLLPDGFRFSAKTTRRDWTEEVLAKIRKVYRQFTDSHGADKVNLQGIVFDTNEGGRLPVEAYLRATLDWRSQMGGHPSEDHAAGTPGGAGQLTRAPARPDTADGLRHLAAARGLSAKYLQSLWDVLNGDEPSLILDGIRQRWRQAQPTDAASLAAAVEQWQKALWKFSSVGHIGKAGGPKAWMEPVNPLTEKQEFRLKLAAAPQSDAAVVFLVANDAGDGNASDFVLWQQPRIVIPGQPDLLLRDAPGFIREKTEWGLDPELFGKHPNGSTVDSGSLCVQAPSVIEVHLPADLVAGAEFVTTAMLHPETGGEGSVQLQLTTTRPAQTSGLVAGEATVIAKGGLWTSDNRQLSHSTPILVLSNSAASQRIQASFDEFRRWFPAALCYQKIVPVDEVITLTLFHREDGPLCRLMLDEKETAGLDRLWDELRYISRDAITLVDAFDQLWQYTTQDADPKVFEPLRQPIRERAAALQHRLIDTQLRHIEALVEFASRAYRRPLSDNEAKELRSLYSKLRNAEIPHEEAFQLTLARVFVAPAFLYRLEQTIPGKEPTPVSDWELASRLSYFLWSSAPDQELRQLAACGRLHDEEVLTAQARRMLADGRVRRLAAEFGMAWLHLYDFAELNEKSEQHFPSFAAMREPLNEEAVRYLTDAFQSDASVMALFDSDYTFLNETLAGYYQIPNVTGPDWRRVDGVKKFGRGGVLTFGATLARQSGASRTSPILRGNWVAEVLLGDKLPRPPKDVPRLPEDEAAETLTVRQLVEKHSSDARCATCHRRIDGFGFALEGYDAIGRVRTTDLAGRAIETRATVFDGTTVEGADGLRAYLLTRKREVAVRQFCRKLLGYALGRGVLLSDKPLLTEMQRQMSEHEGRLSVAVETIVRSQQFGQIRGRDRTDQD